MPELPEVETVCRGLRLRLAGRRLVRVQQRRPDLRWPLPPRLGQRLTGRRVERIDRRAKYILVHLDDGMVLIAHLGMSGRMVATDAPGPVLGPHDHVVFETDDGSVVVFHDARRFGMMDLTPAEDLAGHRLLAALGPEPLGDGFDGAYLTRVLTGRIVSIKAALLDQRLVAGIGNIYACESLFQAGLSPRRRAGSVIGRRADRLAAAVKAVLAAAIAAGGSSVRDYVQASGELGWFQHAWAVYDREGRACPGCTCDLGRTGGVRRIVQGGRSSFFCPVRQR